MAETRSKDWPIAGSQMGMPDFQIARSRQISTTRYLPGSEETGQAQGTFGPNFTSALVTAPRVVVSAYDCLTSLCRISTYKVLDKLVPLYLVVSYLR